MFYNKVFTIKNNFNIYFKGQYLKTLNKFSYSNSKSNMDFR